MKELWISSMRLIWTMTPLIYCMRNLNYMIEELREQGHIKDLPYVQTEKDNLVNIVGNVVGKVDVFERENKNG